MTTNAEPRRCPMCLRWEHGSGACYPAYTNTAVPAPEQQGEPECSCIDVWIDVDPSCPVHRGQIPGRERQPSAPPSSEEAEAREQRGRRVRDVWLSWAREQPNPKPSWLLAWDELSESDREVDRRIGSALWGDGFSDGLNAGYASEAAIRSPLEERVERLRHLIAQDDYEIDQTLGKALGYPWYKDDQKNFPGATEADGVCTGEHVPASLAIEAADRIKALEERVRELQTVDYRCEQMCEAAQYGGSCRCSELSNELPALEEERDRLRSLVKHWRGNHARQLSIKRRLHAMYGSERARAQAAEAQVAKLREALGQTIMALVEIEAYAGQSTNPHEEWITARVQRALAETVQEGGETQ